MYPFRTGNSIRSSNKSLICDSVTHPGFCFTFGYVKFKVPVNGGSPYAYYACKECKAIRMDPKRRRNNPNFATGATPKLGMLTLTFPDDVDKGWAYFV